MKKGALVILLLLLVGSLSAQDSSVLGEPGPTDRHRRAVAEIERLGGQVELKTRLADGHRYLMVATSGGWAGGDRALVFLKDLEGLEKLRLGGDISNAGLEHLDGLRELRGIDLHLRTITDAGLVHLKGLDKLERLNLTYAPITDAGLRHLERLESLKWLGLVYTRVTRKGVERLQERLPDLIIQGSY